MDVEESTQPPRGELFFHAVWSPPSERRAEQNLQLLTVSHVIKPKIQAYTENERKPPTAGSHMVDHRSTNKAAAHSHREIHTQWCFDPKVGEYLPVLCIYSN